jgi:hypothetical protein
VAKVLLEVRVGDLCLAIRFRVIGRRKVNRDTKAVADGFPELRNEEASPVGDDRIREAVELPDLSDEALG